MIMSHIYLHVGTTLIHSEYNRLNPLDNIGKTEKQKSSQIYTQLTWHKDNDGRKLSLKYFCLMCYCFQIISEIRSNNE